MFRDRLARHDLDKREASFLSVPILVSRKPVGALVVELPFKRQRDYDHLVRILRLVASMIGHAVRVERLVDAERQRLIEENAHLREELRQRYDFSRIIGTSGPMRQVYEQIARVARANTTVLIRGESGTGKELIAHAIHYSSPRANKPFVKVSCAALPDSLIESELFGYEKGAFTGAQTRKKGRFELAEAGTLFLDEIGEINLSTQVKLLRVLQEREFERLGGTEPIKANVRLIAATNSDLEKAIAAGTLREDLHYRLNVFTIYVPPLRDRKPDILLLVDHFLEKYSIEHSHHVKRILDARHRHADGVSLARQRARARERHRAGRARVRRQRRASAPSAADAADGRSLGDGDRRVAGRRGGCLREEPHSGRAQDGARQRHQGRQAPALHRAHHQLSHPQARHRPGSLPRVAPSSTKLWSDPKRRQFCQFERPRNGRWSA
jgi:MoxR-like ATPase